MIYVITKLRLDIHWGQCNLSLGERFTDIILFMSLIKCFQKFLLSQEGDNELLQFHLLSNHSLSPLLDLLTVECIRDTKVDHPPITHTC